MSTVSIASTNVAGHSVTILVARIFLAVLFLVSGVGILMAGPAGFGGYLGSLGVPAPIIVAWLVTVLKIVGAVALIVGFQTRIAAYALAAFTIGAAVIGHNNLADQMEMTQFLKDFAIAGGLLLLATFGPGALSLDARRG